MFKRRIKAIIPAQGTVAQYGYLGFDIDEDKAIPCITNECPVICWALMEQDGEQYIVGVAIFENGDIDACDNRDDFLGYKQPSYSCKQCKINNSLSREEQLEQCGKKFDGMSPEEMYRILVD